ncbi:MAG: sigma-70 family RNA polymerase sigma factor [Planctomycetes bacterium]|nr:sigma-70 family RNA polymerase sigma factor [Planctomycetota bacterium]
MNSDDPSPSGPPVRRPEGVGHPGSGAAESAEEPLLSPQLGGALDESEQEDLEWIRRTLAGDKSAYDQLYLKHRERVFAIVHRVIRNREDALEGVQEVFIKIYRALPRFKETHPFGAWLYRISVNHAIDIYRRRRTRREQQFDQEYTVARDDQPVHSRFPNPEKELDRREISRRIVDALSKLNEDQRDVFVLFSYQGLSYSEISETLGIPIGTVMSRLFYARRKLQEVLPAHWDPGGPMTARKSSREGQATDREKDR